MEKRSDPRIWREVKAGGRIFAFEEYWEEDDAGFCCPDFVWEMHTRLKVFEEAAARLEGQAKSLEPIIQHQDWVAQRMGAKRPRIDSILAPFSKDSVYVGLARVVRDSSRYPAWFRLVGVRKDTLMVPVDTVKVDSLKAEQAIEEVEE